MRWISDDNATPTIHSKWIRIFCDFIVPSMCTIEFVHKCFGWIRKTCIHSTLAKSIDVPWMILILTQDPISYWQFQFYSLFIFYRLFSIGQVQLFVSLVRSLSIFRSFHCHSNTLYMCVCFSQLTNKQINKQNSTYVGRMKI